MAVDNSILGRLDRIERNEARILSNEDLILRYLAAILRKENLELHELEQIEGVLGPRTFPKTTAITVTRA